MLLSLRRRKRQGPTLVSRALGVADDCLLLFIRRDARLDRRRMRLVLELTEPGAVAPAVGPSRAPFDWFLWLWPRRELELVLRETMDSGSWKFGGYCSSSKAREGSGDAWMEELLVRTAVSGDIMGDPLRELEATEDPLTAEVGTEVEAWVSRLAWAWLGCNCFGCVEDGMGIL